MGGLKAQGVAPFRGFSGAEYSPEHSVRYQIKRPEKFHKEKKVEKYPWKKVICCMFGH